jgi:hypothetical protein
MTVKLSVVAGVLALGVSLHAGTVFDFQTTNFQDSTGAAQTFISGANSGGSTSVTGTVTAYSASAYSAGTTGLTAASIGTYGSGYGMGVCDTSEGGPGCSSPNHQVDNASSGSGYGAGPVDFVLITFSTAVNLSSIQLGFFGSNSSSDLQNMSYWTNVATTVVNGVTIYNSSDQTSTGAVKEVSTVSTTGESTLTCDATAGQADSCATNGNSLTYGATNAGTGSFSGTNVTSLLIAAQYAPGITAANTSYFKIQDLTVTNYSPAGVPEPASFVLIGSGLLAGALVGRRRRNAKANA